MEGHHFWPRRTSTTGLWEACSRNGTPFSLPLLQSEGKQFLHSLSDEAITENLPMAPNILSEPVALFLLQVGLKIRDHVAEQSSVKRPADDYRRTASALLFCCQAPLPDDLMTILAILGPEVDWMALMARAKSSVCSALCFVLLLVH